MEKVLTTLSCFGNENADVNGAEDKMKENHGQESTHGVHLCEGSIL